MAVPRHIRSVSRPVNTVVIDNGKDGPTRKLQPVADSTPDMLSYGSVAFAKSVSSDLLSELLQVYDAKDAYCIMAIATLRERAEV